MKSKQKPKFLLVLLVFMAILMGTASITEAVPVRISADVLGGLSSYDSDTDGFGLILENYDLGAVDLDLTGILLNVTTTNISGSSWIRVVGGDRWNINDDKGSITYSFNQPVSFHFSTGGGSSGPFTGVEVIVDDGELTEFTGSPGSFTFFNPNPVDPNLTVGANFIQNISDTPGYPGDAISQGFAYGATSGVTTLTMTQDDLTIYGGEGLFKPSGDFHAWIDLPNPVPEPTTIALLGIGLVGLAGGAVRKKRKKRVVEKN